MAAIIIEWVLFAALIVTGVVLVKLVVEHYTPLGRRLRQGQNRKRIDRLVDRRCPTHGLQREEDLVRLESGEVICPVCYREALETGLEP
jgi:hypothetical protein